VAQDPRGSGFGVRRFTGQEFYTLRNRDRRFPESTGAVDHSRDTWREIPADRDSVFRGFRQTRNLYRGSAIREIPKRTWQGGIPKTGWETGVKALGLDHEED
jgi:hypothetical protein